MQDSLYSIDHIKGPHLLMHPPSEWSDRPGEEGSICVPGSHGYSDIYFSDFVLSKHILAIGSIGSGKSTLIYHMVSGILDRSPDSNDRVIFFDAKGDYIRHFWRSEYACLGSDETQRSEAWNLMADIMETPDSEPNMELLRQIATTLFKKQIETSNNPTFPCGARDLFVGLVKVFIKQCQRNGNYSFTQMNNATLKQFFNQCVTDGEAISELLNETPEQAWLKAYLIAPKSATTQSYLAPLQTMLNDVFIGCFSRAGSFSIHQFMKGNTAAKVLFLEYDPEKGCLIDTVYTALLDLAMKESIGRGHGHGNCYFFLDEFPMIPALTYIGQLLQFGRSLGVKVIAAMQNTAQMEQKYGEAEAVNILSGFSTVVAFRLFDEKSRDIISARHGKRLVTISCNSSNYNAPNQELIQEMDAVTDWDITLLEPGQCIISPYKGFPFSFFPNMFHPRETRRIEITQAQPRSRHTMRILPGD